MTIRPTANPRRTMADGLTAEQLRSARGEFPETSGWRGELPETTANPRRTVLNQAPHETGEHAD